MHAARRRAAAHHPGLRAAGLATRAELDAARRVVPRTARPAARARAHRRRHRAPGGARTSATRSPTTPTRSPSSGGIPNVSAEILSATRESGWPRWPAWEPTAMEGGAARARRGARASRAGKIFQPLRVALTGLTASPGIFDVLLYVGRERSLARLDAGGAVAQAGSERGLTSATADRPVRPPGALGDVISLRRSSRSRSRRCAQLLHQHLELIVARTRGAEARDVATAPATAVARGRWRSGLPVSDGMEPSR